MMKKKAVFAITLLCFAFAGLLVRGQTITTQVLGNILDSNGQPLAGAQVVYTSLSTARVYRAKTDKKGEFAMVGLPLGDYQIEVLDASGLGLFKEKRSITSDPESHTLSVNLSKLHGNPALTQEQRDAIKAQREKALSENELITQANTAMQARNYQEAAPALQKLVVMEPNRYEFCSGLGTAQLNLGEYREAIQSFEQCIPLAQSALDRKEDASRAKAALGQMLTNDGNAHLKLQKTNEAVALYTRAAALDPNPGLAYFNLCATQYNAGQMEAAAAACDKAIQADPSKADAYFIKGSSLYGSGTLDKQNKYIVPPGTVEALQKYLELAPQGGHADDVKAMLEALGTKIETSFGKKNK